MTTSEIIDGSFRPEVITRSRDGYAEIDLDAMGERAREMCAEWLEGEPRIASFEVLGSRKAEDEDVFTVTARVTWKEEDH